jgi:carbon-monoxide dehydrogenase medium subunit
LALLGIWLASVLGLFESIEGMLYDQLWRIQYGAERGSRVLLIEVDARRLDSEDPLWSRLLEQLQASGARPLVFGFVPPRASTEFFQRAAAAQVLLARRPLKDPDLAAGGDWERLPAAAQGLALTTGLLAPPEPALGVYRRHWLQVAQFGTQGTSPWALAAHQAGQELPGGDQFRLDFRGGSARLARLPLDQVLAGGLVPELTRDRAVLVSLTGIAEMQGVCVGDGGLHIGAATPHAVVAKEAAKHYPALADLAGGIGDPAVRSRGTIGGSIANNDPAACYPSAVLASGATVVTNRRKIAADDYFQGLFSTALEEGEFVTSVIFPIPQKAAYVKFNQPASRFALTGVFVAKFANGVRVGVTGAGNDGVFRWAEAERALAPRVSQP